MSSITIRIPDRLRKDLDALSRQRQLPVSDLVRESLSRFVASQKFRQLREKTVPAAEANGFLTDEDVFREVS